MPEVNDERLQVLAGEETLFGELKVSNYNPIMQNYSLYGMINEQIYTTGVAVSGLVEPNENGMETNITISNDLNSTAYIQSARVLKYRPGYSNLTRFNVVFDTGTTGCLQYAGLGNVGSDIYFCYDGMDFGVRYSTNGYCDVHVLTITVAESLIGTAILTLNGVNFNVSLINALLDTSYTAYQIAKTTFSGWIVENIGNKVYFQATTPGPKNGSFSLSAPFLGTVVGSFTQERVGQNLISTFIPMNEWNGSSELIQTLNPQMRNMYAIEYSWYGSGNILYKIYNPRTSRYETVHTLMFANLQTTPSLSAPNLFLRMGIQSLTSTTPKSLTIAGGFAATVGITKITIPVFGVVTTKSIAANTETNLVCLKNRNTVNGYENQSEVHVLRISFACDGNKPVTITMIKNPTMISNASLSDYLSWTYVNQNNSISLYDIKSKTYTGGQFLGTFQLEKSGSLYIDLSDREITMFQKDTILFTAKSRAVSEIDISINLLEDL